MKDTQNQQKEWKIHIMSQKIVLVKLKIFLRGIDVTESDLDKIAGRMNTLKRIKEKYKKNFTRTYSIQRIFKRKII